MSNFKTEIKKDVSFLHVIKDIETFISDVGKKLDLGNSLSNINHYPALNVTGNIDEDDLYLPFKLKNEFEIRLSGGVNGAVFTNGSSNINLITSVDASKHTHPKPYLISNFVITTNGWIVQAGGDNYTKTIPIEGMISTENVIAQIDISEILNVTGQDIALEEWSKLRRFVPVNGHIIIHAKSVPTVPLKTKLIRLI